MIVVSDTTTLSNFLQIGRLDLLPAFFDTVIIPPAMYQGLRVLDQFGISTQPLQQADWLIPHGGWMRAAQRPLRPGTGRTFVAYGRFFSDPSGVAPHNPAAMKYK